MPGRRRWCRCAYGTAISPPGRAVPATTILQMFRSEVRIFGADLADWVVQEFGIAPLPEKVADVTVDFWGDLL